MHIIISAGPPFTSTCFNPRRPLCSWSFCSRSFLFFLPIAPSAPFNKNGMAYTAKPVYPQNTAEATSITAAVIAAGKVSSLNATATTVTTTAAAVAIYIGMTSIVKFSCLPEVRCRTENAEKGVRLSAGRTHHRRQPSFLQTKQTNCPLARAICDV